MKNELKVFENSKIRSSYDEEKELALYLREC